MSKPDLSTVEGVSEWVYGQAEDLYHARGSDTETAAYIAECVRLRVAFDALLVRCEDGNGVDMWDMGALRDAMKGEDK